MNIFIYSLCARYLAPRRQSVGVAIRNTWHMLTTAVTIVSVFGTVVVFPIQRVEIDTSAGFVATPVHTANRIDKLILQ